MAVAIPVIAAFASAGAAAAAAGGVIAAMGTVTGFLSIAGAALVTVGAVTKNSKLTKIGGFMGLAGGIGTALGMGASAAGSASGAAAQEAANAAWSSGGAAEVAGGAGASSVGGAAEVAGAALPEGMQVAGQEAASQAANNLSLANAGANAGPAVAEPSLMQTGFSMKEPGVLGTQTYDFSPLQSRATGAGLTANDVAKAGSSSWDKATAVAGDVGRFARENKELVNMGGSMLSSMYGPEAEKMQLLKDRDAFDQSIYRRRMANMNAPVKLSYGGR